MCVCLHISVLRKNLPLQVFSAVIDLLDYLACTIFSPFSILQVMKSWWEPGNEDILVNVPAVLRTVHQLVWSCTWYPESSAWTRGRWCGVQDQIRKISGCSVQDPFQNLAQSALMRKYTVCGFAVYVVYRHPGCKTHTKSSQWTCSNQVSTSSTKFKVVSIGHTYEHVPISE